MKLDNVIRLLDAGYTRDEIMAMEEGASEQGYITLDDPQPEAAPADEQEIPEDAQPERSEVDKTAALIAQLTAQVTSLTKQIQRSNLLNAQQPAAQEPDSAEKVLASIITPNKHK